MPFFDTFLGLVGGLFAAPTAYFFPVLFYCGATGTLQQDGSFRDTLHSMAANLQDTTVSTLSLQSSRTFRALSGSLLDAAGSLAASPPFACGKLLRALHW